MKINQVNMNGGSVANIGSIGNGSTGTVIVRPKPKLEFDGTVLVVRNFATPKECAELKQWTLGAVEQGQFVQGIHRDNMGPVQRVNFRLTNRINEDAITYPPLVYTMQERIAEFLALAGCGPIQGHGKDGVVCSVTYDGGDVYRHVDPSVGEGLEGLRCNLLVSEPESGGTIYVNDRPYTLSVGDLQCYLVTKHYHSVDACEGGPRILLMFGWCV